MNSRTYTKITYTPCLSEDFGGMQASIFTVLSLIREVPLNTLYVYTLLKRNADYRFVVEINDG
jgi:hypothetical protein